MRSHCYAGGVPRQVDHEQRRREIAYGVLAVVAERGLAAVSLRSVAAAAGVSMGRVQHYFAGKDELVAHACRVVADLAEEGYGDEPGSSARARLYALLTLGFPASETSRAGASAWYAFVTAAATDPGLARVVREAWSGMDGELVALLRRAEADGDLAAGVDVAATAHELAATVDGLVLRILAGALEPEEARRAVERRLDVLLPPA